MKASAMIPAALRLASGRQPIAMPRYTEASGGRTVTDVTRLARLLLVDDSRGDVILARRNLLGEGGMGCELSVARTAAEAMEILIVAVGHGRPIDLILLDIGLPGENGFSLLDRIRMTPRLTHTPVIVCSGSGHETDRRQARQLGVIGYMVKPPSLDQLKHLADLLPRLDLVEDGDGTRLEVTRAVVN